MRITPDGSLHAGSRTCYQRGCREQSCVAANRAYAAEHQRARRHALSSPDAVWVPFLPAGPVRRHVRLLAEHGIGLHQIASASGVSYSALHRLMHGDRSRQRRRTRTVTRHVAHAVLAVSSSDISRRRVPSADTERMLAELGGAGVSRSEVARRIGRSHPDLRFGPTVLSSTEAAVRRVHTQAVGVAAA